MPTLLNTTQAQPALTELAVTYRALQFFAHIAHNLVGGESFFSDHDFLGTAYGDHASAYDAIVERIVGSDLAPDLFSITADAAARVQSFRDAKGTQAMLTVLLDGEREAARQIDAAIASGGLSQGTINLLAGLADAGEVRIYKLRQRLQGDE
jgi:DNA-binding ferritin-like protein